MISFLEFPNLRSIVSYPVELRAQRLDFLNPMAPGKSAWQTLQTCAIISSVASANGSHHFEWSGTM